jgi:hypothetical protein
LEVSHQGLWHPNRLLFSANAIIGDIRMISILSNKLSIHITLRSMHNFATGAILIKMFGILALGAIQATFSHESDLINKSTFVLLGNIPKTLMLESEPLTLPHLVIGVFTPMTIYECFAKTIHNVSQFMILNNKQWITKRIIHA